MNGQTKHYALPMVLLATAMFSAMGGPALAPALPAIKAAYADIPNIEFLTKLLIAVSGVAAAIGAPLFGWLSDRWGRKKALIVALSAWGIFGSSGLIPQPFWGLVLGRAALGLSLGGLLAANTAMIADSFSRDRQRHMMGLQSTFSSCGVIISLVISGWLADAHWRWPFALFLGGFLILPAAVMVVEPPRSTHSRNTELSLARKSMLGAGLLFFFAFMGTLAFNIIPTQMPFVMKAQGIETARKLGLLLVAMPASAAVAGRIYSHISKRMPPWIFFTVIGVVMLTGFHVLTFSRHAILPGLILVGTGFGLAMPHVNFVMSGVVRQSARGRAMGTLTSCKFFGQFFSPILLQPVLARHGYDVMLQTAGWVVLFSAVLVFAAAYCFRIEPAGGENRILKT